MLEVTLDAARGLPSVTAEEAAVMGPWIKLAGHLGAFVGQMTDEPIKAINVLYDGVAATMKGKAMGISIDGKLAVEGSRIAGEASDRQRDAQALRLAVRAATAFDVVGRITVCAFHDAVERTLDLVESQQERAR